MSDKKKSISTPNRISIDHTELIRSLAIPFLAYEATPPYRIIDENEAHEKVAMTKRDEIIGRPFLEVYPDTSDEYRKTGKSAPIESIKKIVRTKQPDYLGEFNWKVRGKDGRYVMRYWRSTQYPVFDGDKVVAIYQLTEDTTEQQRIDELVELNRAKEDFISIASHQLRTPATGVKQYLGMVVEGFVGDVPKAQMELLKQAYRSNERQLRIISDLLKVAQVDSGKMKLHSTPVRVDELLEEVIDEQMSTLADRQQTIELRKADMAPPAIPMDSHAMRMVMENIIDNASKYSPEKSTIYVAIDHDATMLSILVYDSGVGIEEHDLPRLYEKFTRFDNLLSNKVGGSGLGLYWAKRIVDMHGGRIDYRPNHPEGSVFTIVLPKEVGKKSERTHTTNAS